MNEWYFVLVFALVGGAFLLGRWCGIRDFERKLDEEIRKTG